MNLDVTADEAVAAIRSAADPDGTCHAMAAVPRRPASPTGYTTDQAAELVHAALSIIWVDGDPDGLRLHIVHGPARRLIRFRATG